MSGRRDAMEALFRPRSLAVVGASDSAARIGGRPIQATLDAGYGGTVLPVNPRRQEVRGLRCAPSLRDLEQPVDLCLLAVGGDKVLPAVEECAQLGVRAAIVFASGYGETGADGEQRQRELHRLARDSGMALLGPNCLGVLNPPIGFMGSFSASLETGLPRAGNVGFVCQSGAIGSYVLALARERAFGFAAWVATGNEADVTAADCIEYLAGRPEVKVIAGYLEGVRDGPAFRHALAAAQEHGKPVVMLKAGRSEAGSRAALSHTGAMVGDDRVFDAVFDRYGVQRVTDLDALLDVTEAAALETFPRGRRLCLLSVSGGVGILMADAAADAGLELPPLDAATQAELRQVVSFAGLENPVDFTGQFLNEPTVLARFLARLSSTGAYDALLLFLGHTAMAATLREAIADTLRDVRGAIDVPLFLSAVRSPEVAALAAREGLPLIENPVRAVMAVGTLARLAATTADRDERESERGEHVVELGHDLAGALDERASLDLLRRLDFPIVRSEVAADPQAAARAARELDEPLVVKVLSAEIPHKSEIGGVVTRLEGAAAVERAAEEVLERAARRVPGARVDGLLVQEMATGSVELIVGARRDETFGPLVLCGLGGIHAEVLGQYCVELAPLSPSASARLLRSGVHGDLLRKTGFASGPGMEALADALSRLSWALIANERIMEVDVNPLIVDVAAGSVVAADALVVLRRGPATECPS